jgi:hypothetical protein
MPRKSELLRRRDKALALAEIEREKREAMRAAVERMRAATETPEERAEREAREVEFAREQAARWEKDFWERKEREYRSKRGSH